MRSTGAKLGRRMTELPRLALATPATGPEPSLASLALAGGADPASLASAAFSDTGVSDGDRGRGTGHRLAGTPPRCLADAPGSLPRALCPGGSVSRDGGGGRDARRADVASDVHLVRLSGRFEADRRGARLAGRRGGFVPSKAPRTRFICRGCRRESTPSCSTSWAIPPSCRVSGG